MAIVGIEVLFALALLGAPLEPAMECREMVAPYGKPTRIMQDKNGPIQWCQNA